VRTGSGGILAPVLHHNAMDLLTAAELWGMLAARAARAWVRGSGVDASVARITLPGDSRWGRLGPGRR
jgi:hypothetical protein